MKSDFSISDLSIYNQITILNAEYNSDTFSYHTFPNDESKLSLLKQLGIYNKTENVCRTLLYKDSSGNFIDHCNVIGFNIYSKEENSAMQLVIKTENDNKIIPINSLFLKDMQKNSFGINAGKEI